MIYCLKLVATIDDIEEVRVLDWHGQPGDHFDGGQLIVELETHKALIEVSAGQAGILRSIICDAGSWARPGEPLAVFSDTADEPLPADPLQLEALAMTFRIV